MTESLTPQGGHAYANGTRFHYEMVGTGEPLVLIHAGVADSRMWDGQLEALSRHFKVVRYDARGFRRTPRGKGRFTWSQDLHGLLRALNLNRVILLGSSKGGTAAIDFALEYPKMTRALVLVAATPGGYQFEGEPPAKLLEFIHAQQQSDLERAAELAVQVWFDGPGRRADESSPGPRVHTRQMMYELLASGSFDLNEDDASGQPAVERLATIRIPTLVVSGECDDPSVIRADDFVASRIPGAVRTVIERGAHLVNVEKPDEFNRAVLSFMRTQGIIPGLGEQYAA